MIVPPVSVMPLVPMTSERFVKADMIFFVVPLFAGGFFRCFGLLLRGPGLWIAVCDMPLRIYRRESLIVNPERAPFTQCLQRARFTVAPRCIEHVRLPGHEAAAFTHCC